MNKSDRFNVESSDLEGEQFWRKIVDCCWSFPGRSNEMGISSKLVLRFDRFWPCAVFIAVSGNFRDRNVHYWTDTQWYSFMEIWVQSNTWINQGSMFNSQWLQLNVVKPELGSGLSSSPSKCLCTSLLPKICHLFWRPAVLLSDINTWHMHIDSNEMQCACTVNAWPRQNKCQP